MARIIVVDDHHVFREGICALIRESQGDTVVASLPNAANLNAKIDETNASIVLLDLSIDGELSFDDISNTKKTFPEIKLIVLSMHSDQDTVETAMQAGADGYALKQDAFEDVIFAIRAAERGGRFISPTIIGKGHKSITMEKPSVDEMPERQRQILQLVAKGRSNKQIADELSIALPTVKNHLSVLFRKYGVTNRVRLLVKLSMIDPMHESEH